jgi:DNA-binding LacI/PurR family transcriptional regulator
MDSGTAGEAGKHPAIRDEIRRRICREGFTGRLPSIRTLASEFGTHAITVGKAVDALVAEGLVRNVPRRGCFVVGRRVSTVLLLVYSHDLERGFYADLARLIIEGLPRHHLRHRVWLHGSGRSGEGFPAPAELSAPKGSVVLTVGLQDRNYMLALMDAGLPVVALDYVPTDPAITAVGVDNLAAGSEATRVLLERGARDILFVGHGRPGRTEVDALLLEVGYRVAMEEAGRAPRSVFAARATPEHGAEAFAAALRSAPPPDGVFTSNPELVQGVRDCCRERGLAPPEHQITLDFLTRFPELPAVRVDLKRFCEAALDLARAAARGRGLGPRQVLVRPRIDLPGGA